MFNIFLFLSSGLCESWSNWSTVRFYLVRHKYDNRFLLFAIQVRRNNRRNCDWLSLRSASDWLLFRRDVPPFIPETSRELSTDHCRAPWGTLWGSPLIHVINKCCTMSGRCMWQLKLLMILIIMAILKLLMGFLSFIGM